jgi:hypothetical protein
VDAERETAHHFIDELHGGPLVTGVVDLQHSNAGAVIDGGELIQAFASARDPLEKLHVQL